jgi:prepilin-type N-terminal cleavage/methylation domain-containing protein/prepilin-type processing-associated H-X9-DG protein
MRRAFTLIELLVVITIIAVLAAILFPVFAQAKRAAKSAVCISNTKQMALAYVLYTQDYDDVTVPMYYYDGDNSDTSDYQGWFSRFSATDYTDDPKKGLLYPYMRTTSVADCPDGAQLVGLTGSAYGMNSWLVSDYVLPNDPYGVVNLMGIPYSKIEEPADTVAFGDSAQYGFWDKQLYRYDWLTPPGGGSMPSQQGRHGDFRANFAWADGHSKSLHLTRYTTVSPWLADQGVTLADFDRNNLGGLTYKGMPVVESWSDPLYLPSIYYFLDQKVLVGGS